MNINKKLYVLLWVSIIPLYGMENANKSAITIDPYNIAAAGSFAWLTNTKALNKDSEENIKIKVPIVGGKFFIPKKKVLSIETSNAIRQICAPIPDAANVNVVYTGLKECMSSSKDQTVPTSWSKLNDQVAYIGTSANLTYAKKDLLSSPIGEYINSCSSYLQTCKEQALIGLPSSCQKGVNSMIGVGTNLGGKALHGISAYCLQERLHGSSNDTSASDLTLALEFSANILDIYSKHTMPHVVQIATGIGTSAARFNTIHALYDPQGNTNQENGINMIAGVAGATLGEMVEHSAIGQSYKTWIENSRFKEHHKLCITLFSTIIRFFSQELIRLALRKYTYKVR